MRKLLLFLILAQAFPSCKDKTAEKKTIPATEIHQKIVELPKAESEKIIEIIKNGDVKGIPDLLKKGVDVDSKFEGFFRGGRRKNADDFSNKEWTMLMVATFYNQEKIAELLLENKADINLQNKAGHTALFLACANRSEEMAKFLLEKGANATIDSKDSDGTSTLQWAIAYEWNDVVQKLLEQNIDVNSSSTETGRSVLLDALYSETISEEVISTIIGKGANVNYINPKDGENALMMACRRDFSDIAKMIVSKGGNVNSVSKSGTTPLSCASGKNSCSTELMEFLIEKGAKINPTNKYGRTPLIEAVSSNCIEKVKFLVEKGANVNQKRDGGGGISPLSEAVWETNFEITKYLVENGADVNIQKDNGDTALMEAVWNEKNYNAVNLLIQKGADVNKTNDDKQTPLLKAIQYNHYDIAVLLLKNGAGTDVTDFYGHTIQSTLKETVERTGNKKWLDLKL
ncbi:ankyrin repeat domain-containing protein [Epilithonimonas sp. JDS]|uniref:ankyrin repeat domain-containing protein n=1 Tax=Epilithonimonas sp. JDS TaxID=2902797 RepID=UPI001E4198C0|nr:ankyrin repeat domain-containing protein [Epilithonimonas sp. JDS]MCD9855925.1 ankyrin repeat domain-containing protein [Epilithonimonas sp. JDS]